MKRIKTLLSASAFAILLLPSSPDSRAADVGVFGERFTLNVIDDFYEGLAGHSSSILPSLTLDSVAGLELLWAVQPADAYTALELSVMNSFLSGGGRIAFMGEHGTFAPDENNRITAAIAALGGSISILNTVEDGGFQDATRLDGQIQTHPLTQGVDVYNYAAFAPLILGANAEVLMLGSNQTSVMMAYENIGAGSIFLITDQNVWDNVNNASNDNARMFENLLLADTGAPPPPNSVPDSGSTLILAATALLGLIGTMRSIGRVSPAL